MMHLQIDVDTLACAVHRHARTTGFTGVVSITGTDRPFIAAYGLADRSNRLANTPGTRFGIASGTKLLTSLAVGTLVERGAFTADTRVKELLSFDLPNFADEITVAQLLTHTSGVYDYYDESLVEDFDNYFVDIPWYDLTTPRDYLPLFRNEGMKFRPGERFSYSNGGYILLGIVIEEVTGRLFRDVVAESVFAPAGMADSGFFALNRLPGRTAVGYMDRPDGGWQTNVYNLPRIGASDGGAFTTAADVERLWSSLATDRTFGACTREAITERRVAIGPGVSYGYGVYLWDLVDEPAWFVVGCDAGVGFDSRHFPERGVTVSVLSNVTEGEAGMRRLVHDRILCA